MQLSIYLERHLVQQLDKEARRTRRSRSHVVSELLTGALRNGPGQDRAERLADLAGSWEDRRKVNEIVKDIYRQRTASGRRADIA